MAAYYNEIDEAAAHILRALIDTAVIAPGIVDTRSIKDVQPDDLRGFTQCHFFAGGGLWSIAARLAGWPDDRPLWTGSCPCQPFSQAGKGAGRSDPRHLWPDFHRLIRAARPAVVVGEQVAGKAGFDWFDGVATDLGGEGYASRAVDIPAAAVDAPHIRQRLYWVAMADADSALGRIGNEQPAGQQPVHEQDARNDVWPGSRHVAMADADRGGCAGWAQDAQRSAVGGNAAERPSGDAGAVEHAARVGWGEGRAEPELRSGRTAAAGADAPDRSVGNAFGARLEGQHGHGDGAPGWPLAHRSASAPDGRRNNSFWAGAVWLACHDGKARRAEPSIRLLVDGLPGRVDLWRIGGNAIVPQVAAEVLGALMEVA